MCLLPGPPEILELYQRYFQYPSSSASLEYLPLQGWDALAEREEQRPLACQVEGCTLHSLLDVELRSHGKEPSIDTVGSQ
jgi:hypothetical protein